MATEDDPGGGASRSTDPASGTSSATDVSLREYLNEKIDSDRAITRERFIGLGLIGAIIWFFVERHLSDLNHENARILKQQEGTVSSDTYKANEDQRKTEANNLNEWRKEVDKDRTTSVSREEFQQDNRAQRQGIFANRTSIVSIAVALGVLLLLLLTYLAAHHTHPAPIIVKIPKK
jgi:hypothetical protein